VDSSVRRTSTLQDRGADPVKKAGHGFSRRA
jgi:hypothetical protein